MENKTNIIMLLDRSGSMDSIKEETILGFNSFIKKQIESNPNTLISLYQFDDKYDKVFENTPLSNCPELNKYSFIPRGLTALLDAIGITIKRNKPIKNKLDIETNEQTVFVIITDGYENASEKFTLSKVHNLIKKMESKHNWQFVYLGANQDAIKVAATFGIDEKRAIKFASDSLGTRDVFYSTAERVSESILMCNEIRFSMADREKQNRVDNPEKENIKTNKRRLLSALNRRMNLSDIPRRKRIIKYNQHYKSMEQLSS
ncbi:vWA domain-containing protein [Lentimicrobium sp. S6]|uniref:vWA domain-containing protein n=1 Tax=Lentimicrobium sp. S6 TaxID=2735872 RepID=UPI001554F833|nr:vWA domain-containing protein [Lentimicrobium sp. S6]NPD47602.1 VWA domain-containing protein [Lentimicrobium sp. S6]